eukprot:6206420-Pleurochrysis_carterae.AAC.1
MAAAASLDPADFGGKCWRIGGAIDLHDIAGADSRTWRPPTSAPSSTRSSKPGGHGRRDGRRARGRVRRPGTVGELLRGRRERGGEDAFSAVIHTLTRARNARKTRDRGGLQRARSAREQIARAHLRCAHARAPTARARTHAQADGTGRAGA